MKTGIPDLDRTVDELFEAARSRFGSAAIERLMATKWSQFEHTTWGDPRQQATWLYTPGLTARPFWSREQCGRLTEMIVAFESARAQLCAEIAQLNSGNGSTYDHLSLHPDAIRGWKSQFFLKDYKPNAELLAAVPTLAALLKRFDVAQLDRFELFFSLLQPGTRIPAHFGGANQKLTLHLPLWIPDGDLGLRVDQEVRRWEGGDMLIFDDTFEHEAWNLCNQPRGVLLMKAYHPELSLEEIQVIETFTPLNVKAYRSFLAQQAR